MDLCAVHEESQFSIMRFETISHFHTFDSIFGTYARYGTTKKHPSVNETVGLELSHQVATVGNGIPPAERPINFYRRGIPTLGIDLKYNNGRQCLQISARYKIVRVSEDETVNFFLLDREERRASAPSSRLPGSNIRTPYSVTIKAQMDFFCW